VSLRRCRRRVRKPRPELERERSPERLRPMWEKDCLPPPNVTSNRSTDWTISPERR
jgi:hypothetical protein